MNVRDRSSTQSQAMRSYIDEQISSGAWRPGDRLPTERVLSEKYEIARNTVRSVLQALERDGRIVREVGRGTFVAGREGDAGVTAVPTVDDASPSDVMEVRLLVEPGMGELAVMRATQSDLDHIEKCIKRGEAARSWREFERWDAEFHEALARATKNRAVIEILQATNSIRDQAAWSNLKKRSLTSANRKTYEQQHRVILDALRKRDAKSVRVKINQHLLTVRGNLLGY